MADRPKLSTAEHDLLRTIESTKGWIAVFLGETYHPGSRLMADQIRRLVHQRRDFHLIELNFAGYATWSRAQGIFGSPGLLCFHDGELRLRLTGIIDESSLVSIIEQLR